MPIEPPFVEAEFAWDGGDRPGSLAFDHTVSEATANALLASIPESVMSPEVRDNARLSALTPSSGTVGRYRLEAGDLQAFLRVTARQGNPDLERALVGHLAGRGAPVNAFLACGLPVKCPQDGVTLRMDIRPFLGQSRHFSGDVSDLEALGRSLSIVHAALADFPRADEVAANSRRRVTRLQALSAALADDPRTADDLEPYRQWIADNCDWCKQVANEVPPEVLTEADDMQCVHGEPHQGNVLFNGGGAILLDFEEAVNLFASRRWDLAFAVQRFALADQPDEAVRHARLAALVRGYDGPVLDRQAMRCVAWTTLLIVFDLWRQDRIRSPLSECKKFRCHERQAAMLDAPVKP